jgi:xylulokinase
VQALAVEPQLGLLALANAAGGLEQPQVEEGAAYGAALLGGVAGGLWSSAEEAVRACVRARAKIEPEPALVERYRAERARFEALYPAVRPLSEP